jgi:hypothetical protein
LGCGEKYVVGVGAWSDVKELAIRMLKEEYGVQKQENWQVKLGAPRDKNEVENTLMIGQSGS